MTRGTRTVETAAIVLQLLQHQSGCFSHSRWKTPRKEVKGIVDPSLLPPRLQLQPVSVCLYIGKKELKDSPLSSKEHKPIGLDMEYNLIGTDFVKPTPRSLSSDPKGHAVLSKALRTESE
ncbi:hypothetical protein BA78_8487 [Aspergillus fumigatus]|nr:hypothetical protein BA78_8487 [Aspergillus fumigatus]